MSTISETDGVIEALRDALFNKAEPWTSDIVTLPEPAKTLFFVMKDELQSNKK
jgi:hypothetical protein